MILDAQLQLSSSQALTATAASTNYIDLGADRNIGIGEPMSVVIFFNVALAGTTPTFVATVQGDDNTAFSSATSIIASQSASAAAAGSKIVLPLPADSSTERYLRLNYTLGGTTPTATVSAYLMPSSSIQNDVYYADGFTIS